MTKTTQQVKYAVQRHNAIFNNWDTIRETITPLEARARRLMRWKQSLGTRCKFRLVKVETQTTITPIEAEPSRPRSGDRHGKANCLPCDAQSLDP